MDFIHKGVNVGPGQLNWFDERVMNAGTKNRESVTSHKAKEIFLFS